jgi:hypothetical protein
VRMEDHQPRRSRTARPGTAVRTHPSRVDRGKICRVSSPEESVRDRVTLDRLSHRPCPGCVVAMVGGKVDLRSVGYDLFKCRQCGTVDPHPFKESEAKNAENRRRLPASGTWQKKPLRRGAWGRRSFLCGLAYARVPCWQRRQVILVPLSRVLPYQWAVARACWPQLAISRHTSAACPRRCTGRFPSYRDHRSRPADR